MVQSSYLTPGMILSLEKGLFRVESVVKVTVPKGTPFIKVKLREMQKDKIREKNFKVDQQLTEVSLEKRPMEFLYPEGKDFLFLDVKNLEQVLIPSKVMGDRIHYLKQGIEVEGEFYGDTIFSLELPQFLEIMVSDVVSQDENEGLPNATKTAVLETGAKVEVPPFIEEGDVIKVDTKTGEYIQRV